VASAGALKAFRWAEVGTLLAVLLVIGLVALSGLGTLLGTSLSQPAVSTEGKVVTVSLSYHSLNPGPFSTDDVVVSASLLGPNGNLLLSAPAQSFKVSGLDTSSGNLTFALDFASVPQGVYDAFRNGTEVLTLRVGLSSGVAGLVRVTMDSDLALTGVD
jgi:hypothetical protein